MRTLKLGPIITVQWLISQTEASQPEPFFIVPYSLKLKNWVSCVPTFCPSISNFLQVLISPLIQQMKIVNGTFWLMLPFMKNMLTKNGIESGEEDYKIHGVLTRSMDRRMSYYESGTQPFSERTGTWSKEKLFITCTFDQHIKKFLRKRKGHN